MAAVMRVDSFVTPPRPALWPEMHPTIARSIRQLSDINVRSVGSIDDPSQAKLEQAVA
jgi:hypothetical protein